MDVCFDEDDAIFAMRIANMSNTFYKIEIQEFKEDEEVADPLLHPHHVVEHDSKRYLQSDHRLVRHKIWRKPGFWEEALKESVYAQLGPHISLKWDEMNFEELREAISCVHNVLFGQLGTLSFSMLQQGLTKDEVVEHVLNMSKKFQLTEDQEYELIMSITGKKIKEYVPPPVIAVVPAFADAPATTATPGKHTVVRSSPPQPPHNKSSPHSTPKTYTETTPATTSRSSFTRTMRRMASSSSNSSSNPQEPIVVSGKVVQQVESTGRTSESAVEPQKKSRLGFFGSKSSSTQSSQSTPSTTTHSSTTSVQKAVTPSNTKEFALQPVKATTSAHHGNGSATFSPSSDNNHNDDYDDFFAVL